MYLPKKFALYDAGRTLRLEIVPYGIQEALSGIPGEFVVHHPAAAAKLGIDPVTETELAERLPALAELGEDELFRLWWNPAAGAESRRLLVSAVDTLPDTAGAPDWALQSAGCLIADREALESWAEGLEVPETEPLAALSAFLSQDLFALHALRLTETSSGRTLMLWPLASDNPVPFVRRVAESYPEVRYAEEDFLFSLAPEACDEPRDPDVPGA